MNSLEWITPDWPHVAGIHALTTCRAGGVSRDRWLGLNLTTHAGDNQTAVNDNRQRLLDQARLPEEPIWLDQQHGNHVAKADIAGSPSSTRPVVADACFTDQPDCVVAVLTADCLPILVHSADGQQLAAIHAGWRGLELGIIERTVKLFRNADASPSAWIGPAISPQNYCVDDMLRDRFLLLNPDYQSCFTPAAPRDNKRQWQMNLSSIAAIQLKENGVKKIYGSGICNYEDNRFYSHRRDGTTGRMATLIWRSTPNHHP